MSAPAGELPTAPSAPAPGPLDATRRGGVREVASLAYPVVIQNLSITTLHMVDAAMVGRLGPEELAAAGYGGIWVWTAFCLFLGTGSAVQTFVSQAHGAGREHETGRWVWQALGAVWLPITLCAALFALAFPALLAVLSPAEEIQGLATGYVRARSLGAPGIVIAMVVSSFYRGLGDMRTPLVVTLIVNVVNAVLDYGLIFGRLGLPQLGVTGAGLATAGAEWLYAGVMLALVLRAPLRARFGTRPERPELASMRRFARTGLPIGGMWFLDMITFALFTTLIARMGSSQMAASQAFVVLLHVSFMQVIGFQIAAMTLVGRYIGAEDPESASRSFRSALVLGGAYVAAVGALFLLLPGPLLRIFTGSQEVLALGMPLLAVGALFQVGDAGAIIAGGALRGAGDTRWPFLVQTALAWGLFLPLAWLGGITLEGGLTGAWIGATVYALVLSTVLIARFRGGAWRRIRI